VKNLKLKNKVIVIAEIGLSHEGSLGIAKSYIDLAKQVGADYVKFQTHIAEEESSKFEKFRVNIFPQDKSRYEYWNRTSFSSDEWLFLKKYCDKKNIGFISSPLSVKAAKILNSLKVPFFKISSGEIHDKILVKEICKFKKPIFFSSGLSNINDIEKHIDFFKKNKVEFVLMHCTSIYPCPPQEIGLNLIQEFKKRYNCRIGYSDHSGEIFSALSAVTLGATVIESHLTFSKDFFGADTKSSLDPKQFKQMVEGIRYIEKMKSKQLNKKQLKPIIEVYKKIFTKSIFLKRNLKKNHILNIKDFNFKKANTGVSQENLNEILGKKLKKNKKKNDILNYKDIF